MSGVARVGLFVMAKFSLVFSDGLSVTTRILRELSVEIVVVRFINIVRHKLTVPIQWCFWTKMILFAELANFQIHFRPPCIGFFRVNKVANEYGLTRHRETYFIAFAGCFFIG